MKLLRRLKPKAQKELMLDSNMRAMAVELEQVLDDLLYASKEFQSDGVTSSLVYPIISLLKMELIKDLNKYKYTAELRKTIVERICVRFGHILYNDVFLFATFLDPYCGPSSFPSHMRDDVVFRLKEHLLRCSNSIIEQKTSQNKSKNSFRERFMRYDEEESQSESHESLISNTISDYMSCIKKITLDKNKTVLDFWRENESRWPSLASIAKKVLAVPASSAGVERMFSIAGHVFSLKRRRIKARIYESLVFCKLNEDLLNN